MTSRKPYWLEVSPSRTREGATVTRLERDEGVVRRDVCPANRPKSKEQKSRCGKTSKPSKPEVMRILSRRVNPAKKLKAGSKETARPESNQRMKRNETRAARRRKRTRRLDRWCKKGVVPKGRKRKRSAGGAERDGTPWGG